MTKVIYGLRGTELLPEEVQFFKEQQPFGIILFSRNCESREQIKALTASIQDLFNYKVHILIDQEGGRVCRIKPPHFRKCPPAKYFVDIAKETSLEAGLQAAYDNYFEISKELLELGIDFNCAPVADLHYDYADGIIGDRSFGASVEIVTAFCTKVLAAIKDAGGIGIVKHIPGHGRAKLDSHLALPIVEDKLDDLEKTDFAVFKNLAAHANYAMTAHILYSCLDPFAPVTTSAKAIKYIREELGFKGEIMSDDLSMQALGGSIFDRAKSSITAGCDILLHCNGEMVEMKQVAQALASEKV